MALATAIFSVVTTVVCQQCDHEPVPQPDRPGVFFDQVPWNEPMLVANVSING